MICQLQIKIVTLLLGGTKRIQENEDLDKLSEIIIATVFSSTIEQDLLSEVKYPSDWKLYISGVSDCLIHLIGFVFSTILAHLAKKSYD